MKGVLEISLTATTSEGAEKVWALKGYFDKTTDRDIEVITRRLVRSLAFSVIEASNEIIEFMKEKTND